MECEHKRDSLGCAAKAWQCSMCDPIDSELYLGQMKSGETLMEVLSRSDVQFDGMTWVQRRKTNRTVWQLVPSEMSLRTASTSIDLLSKDNVQATWCNICVSAFANSESVGYALALQCVAII